MEYYMPTKIICEENSVVKNAKLLRKYGKRCLIVTGRKSSKENGSLYDVMTALKLEDINYTVFDEVEENPSVETIMKATDIGKLEDVKFVIGIGGGSPLDAAKAIALMIHNKDKNKDLLYSQVESNHLPVIAIPTTAGTGSEVTQYSVLTVHESKTKKSITHKIFPEIAFIDYKYLKYANNTIIKNTAMDALSHMIESYLNVKESDFSENIVLKGLKYWSSAIPGLKRLMDDDNEKLTDDEYNSLMMASTFAGMSISQAGTSFPHALSYMLTYEFNVAHGRAVGTFIPGFVRLFKNNKDIRVESILNILKFNSLEEFESFVYKLINRPCICGNDLEQDIDMLISNKEKLKVFPYDISKEELLKVYNN